MKQQFLITQIDPPVATVTLHRPEVRNAMHIGMIRELTGVIRTLEADSEIRLLRIGSSGPHFCSGADLNWMREGLRQPEEQLRSESLELAALFQDLSATRLVVVTAVRGRAMGGAIGLVAASDIVVAESGSLFACSEAKLGLIPTLGRMPLK
jgi:methylglutaconyl-CoA hydratase